MALGLVFPAHPPRTVIAARGATPKNCFSVVRSKRRFSLIEEFQLDPIRGVVDRVEVNMTRTPVLFHGTAERRAP